MSEIFLDTETTGLSVAEGDRIVEIACVETQDLIPTKKIFHKILNPEKKISQEAFKVHGFSDDFLKDKKKFKDIADEFLAFIKGKKLIIHNAEFDLAFLNLELRLIKKEPILKERVLDTLELARLKFPGSSASLDALCKRFKIDNSKRKKHDAITDCELLSKVYINLIGQKEPTLKLNSDIQLDKTTEESNNNKNYYKKIIYPSKDELSLHNKFLKDSLKRNNF